MKVLLHTRRQGQEEWGKDSREFARIPQTGEYLALSSGSPWYQVRLVVHKPLPCNYSAEIYAVEIDREKRLQQILPGRDKEPWVGRVKPG